MSKQVTSVLLVAGTCIGAGMIALPMSLAKLGVIPSLVVMLVAWFITYYPSLVSVELNLHCERGLSLGLLGRKFSGRCAEVIGEVSVKMLSYALLAAYIYGASSIIQSIMQKLVGFGISSFAMQTFVSLAIVVALLFPTRIVSKINNIAFVGFSGLFLLLIAKVVHSIDFKAVPWSVAPSFGNISSIATIVFTSFGYQVIFHTLRDCCGKDVKMLRRAFFYGSIIPMVVYMLWTCGVISVIYKFDGEFFGSMASGKIEVGDLIDKLANIFSFSKLQVIVWWTSIFTILTSIIGVGLGLTESYELKLSQRFKYSKLLSAVVTVVPAYLASALTPNAFIQILGIAGAILVVIAILLPTYLFIKAKITEPYVRIINKWALLACVLVGIAIMGLEIHKVLS